MFKDRNRNVDVGFSFCFNPYIGRKYSFKVLINRKKY